MTKIRLAVEVYVRLTECEKHGISIDEILQSIEIYEHEVVDGFKLATPMKFVDETGKMCWFLTDAKIVGREVVETQAEKNKVQIYESLPLNGNNTIQYDKRKVSVYKDEEYNNKFDIHFYELADDGTIKDYADYVGDEGWIGGLDANEVVEMVNAFLYRKENNM